jgi:hypothetical protein
MEYPVVDEPHKNRSAHHVADYDGDQVVQ